MKLMGVLTEFQIDMYLKINLSKTTIKQSNNKAVLKKHQEIKWIKRYIINWLYKSNK